jgi:hypothetical protein
LLAPDELWPTLAIDKIRSVVDRPSRMMRDICVAKVYATVRAIEPVTSNGGSDEGW